MDPELKRLLERGVVALEEIAAAMRYQAEPPEGSDVSSLQVIADALCDCHGEPAMGSIALSLDLLLGVLEGPRNRADGTPVGIGNILDTIADRMPE